MSSVNGLLTPNKYDLYCNRLESEVLRTDELLIGAFQPLKGSTLVSNGTSFAPVAVGADGEVLLADSAQPEGVRWGSAGGAGDVVGPASAFDNHIATFDGATGKIIQDGGLRLVPGGLNSFAMGLGAAAAGDESMAIGSTASTGIGVNNIAIGRQAETLNGFGVAIGDLAFSGGGGGVAIGANASGGNALQTVAVGGLTQANGQRSVAVGYTARADAANCVAIGNNARAFLADSVAIGINAFTDFGSNTAVGAYSDASGAIENTALGYSAAAFGAGATVVGAYANTGDADAVVIGYSANTNLGTGTNSVVIGPNTNARAVDCVSIGNGTIASGARSIRIGNGGSATAADAVSIGSGASAPVANSIALGNGAVTDATHTYAITGQVLNGISPNSAVLGNFHNVKINGNDYFVPLYTAAGFIPTISFIELYQTGNVAATAIGVAGTYVKANLTATTSTTGSGWGFTGTNRITYLLTESKVFKFTAVISATVAAATKNVSIVIALNGVPITKSVSYSDITSTTDPNHITCQMVAFLNTNDYAEVWITNNTDTTSVTVTDLNLIAEVLN